MLKRRLVPLASVLVVVLAGCSQGNEEGARQLGEEQGYERGFEEGVSSTLNDSGVKPARNYVVDFEDDGGELRIRGKILLPPGASVTCNSLDVCRVGSESVAKHVARHPHRPPRR